MSKYLILFLTFFTASCGNSNPSTSAEPTTPAATTSPSAPEAQATAPVSPQTPATQTSGTTQVPLTGTYWKLTELNGKSMEGKTEKEMYLFLDPGSPQFKSHSGCNLVMGEAKFTGANQLRFTNLLNTTSECKTPDIDAEFLKAMEAITGYSHKDNTLILTKGGSTQVMKFVAKG